MAGRFSVAGVFSLKDGWTRPLDRMASATQRFTRRASLGLRRVDRSFGRAHQTIKRTAGIVGAATLAAGLAMGTLGKAGADFEQAITDVGAVGLKTRAEIKPLEDLALRLGATTKFTATESANAMEIMAKAGFDSAGIIAGVPGVLSAAAASGLEIAEVADHVSKALKGFGKETKEAGDVADVLALASSRTNSTIGSLGESLRNVASTARELKVPFEDTVAAVALLQDVGLDASVAGSAMNTMLTKLADPPAAVAKQMKKLKLSFKKDNGDMKSFAGVIDTISQAAASAGGNFDKVAFLADLVGLRGQKAASNLATLFEKGKLQELTKELENAKGSAKKMAELRMDTLKGDLTLLESAVDGVKVALFQTEGGPLRGVVKETTKWIGANKELMLSKVGEFLADLKAHQGEIWMWLKRIGKGLVVFYTLAAAVKVARVALAAFQLVMKGVEAVVWLYGKRAAVANTATKAWTLTTRGAAAAQLMLGAATKATNSGLSGMHGAIKAKGIRGALNGITSKLGKAGLLGAALAVGVGLGTWLDHEFGISDMFGKWLSDLDWLNEGVAKLGRFLGSETLVAIGEGNQRGAQARREEEARARAREQRQVISTSSRLTAHSVSETIREERSNSEVTIRDESGKAEVTRQPNTGPKLNLQPSGNF